MEVEIEIEIDYLNELLCKATLSAWIDICNLKIGSFEIGSEFIPTGQLIGNLLHVLIPKHLELLDNRFTKGNKKYEKDIVCKESDFCIEIKTSSSTSGVYGNRSYNKSNSIKEKDSYYLIVNYVNFTENSKGYISSIRVGYIKKDQWKSQSSESGQQSYLTDKSVLQTIYKK